MPEPGRLRVLFVIDHLGYEGGVSTGGTTYLELVLGRLREAGIDPRLYVLRGPHPRSAARLQRVGIEPVFLGRAKWDPRSLWDLVRASQRERADVLHLNGEKAHLLGRLVAILTRRRSIVHLHFEYRPRPGFFQPWLGTRTSKLLAVSRRLADHGRHALRVPPHRVEVLYNGIDLERFSVASSQRDVARCRLGLPPTTPIVVAVGRLALIPDKGHRQLVLAMSAVLRRVPRALLLIAGDGPARPTCERLVEELGLGSAIRFLGFTDRVPDLLVAADVAVVPSMCEDAFPYAALEGAAAGRPVVGFRVGGMPECVRHGHTGLLLDRGDVDALADGISTLLEQPRQRASMGAEARRFAAGFSIERHVQRLVSIYHELIAVEEA
jgi:glycosyltransferase involved in cell wall biosynthesis